MQELSEIVKTKEELLALCTFVMCHDAPADRWSDVYRMIRAYANETAKEFGYASWVDAYHKI